jgi:hypothetical protein
MRAFSPLLRETRLFGKVGFLTSPINYLVLACDLACSSVISFRENVRIAVKKWPKVLSPNIWLLAPNESNRSQCMGLCDRHLEQHGHQDNYDPVQLVNSPRLGMCGYDGPAEALD